MITMVPSESSIEVVEACVPSDDDDDDDDGRGGRDEVNSRVVMSALQLSMCACSTLMIFHIPRRQISTAASTVVNTSLPPINAAAPGEIVRTHDNLNVKSTTIAP